MSRVPNYVLSEPYSLSVSAQKNIVLDSGSFVRPIYFAYVPIHILERYKECAKDDDFVFCYCYFGIIPIPKSKIREVQ